jgi:hypothetical protein
LAKRKPPKSEANSRYVFLTKYGGAWYIEKGNACAIAQEYRKLADDIGVYRKGLRILLARIWIAMETRSFTLIMTTLCHARRPHWISIA